MVNKKHLLRWVMLILWMCFIFYMSSQSGDESQEQSDLVLSILNSASAVISSTHK